MNILNIGSFLPMECYPIEGRIILRYRDNDNIFATGTFQINWGDKTIYMESDMNNIYPKFSSDNRIVIESIDSPCIYKYELVAKKQLTVGDIKTNNLLLNGIATINSDITLTMNSFYDVLSANLNPIFDKDGVLFNMSVW